MILQAENPVVEIHDLTVSYIQKPVLWNIDLTIPGGKITGIIGPNGAGKSTLIKAVMGIIKPANGYARLFELPVDEVRERISYVPQRGSVDWDFPASVYDVVMMGRYRKAGFFRGPRRADKEVVEDSIRKVGMEEFRDRQISQLSGGQQQRVFIARALAQQADIYFLDEPFAGVDAATENQIITLLREMASKGKTIIAVHHDLQSAVDYFQWLILLNSRLIASGPSEKVFTNEMLQKTYGGKLTILSELGAYMKKEHYPAKELS